MNKKIKFILFILITPFLFVYFLLINTNKIEFKEKIVNNADIVFNLNSSYLNINSNNVYSSQVTVVSVYFSFKSKHSQSKYLEWIKNFLKSVNQPLIIYTDEKTKDFIIDIRTKLNYTTTIYVYDDIWSIMKELEMERKRSYLNEYLTNQLDKDPEKSIHNSNLYLLCIFIIFVCKY